MLRVSDRRPESTTSRLRFPSDGLACALAGVLFAAITLLRWRAEGAADAIALLYCVPTVLIAFRLGVRGGLAASAISLTLLIGWVICTSTPLTVIGWTARVIPLVLCGVAPGWLVDQSGASRTEADRPGASETPTVTLHTLESNDRLVQHVVSAKWCLESGHTERALAIMAEAAELGHSLVSDLARDSGLSSHWTGNQEVRLPETP